MDALCEKYRLNHELVRLLVELEFSLVIHCKIKVNRILFSPELYRDWKSFKEKHKKCRELYVVSKYLKAI